MQRAVSVFTSCYYQVNPLSHGIYLAMSLLEPEAIARLRRLAEEFAATLGATEVGELLGAGASAAVFELDKRQARRALKVYEPSFLLGAAGLAERRRLGLQQKLVGHTCPHLVQLYGVSFHADTCLVEMDRVAGRDLHSVLSIVPRTQIANLVSQLVLAVEFLESQNLAHRDIKPHNIKISPDFQRLTLLDLGVVREFDYDVGPDATAQGPKKPFVATAQYSSPEYLFWLHPPSRALWHALSIYQVGAVLHDLIMKKALFSDEVATENRYALAMAVLQKIPDTHADDLPASLCALAARCLTKQMDRRAAMVTWKDFANTEQPSVIAARRFKQISKVGFSAEEERTSRHERLLRRDELMSRVLELVHSKTRATYEGCQLERISIANLRGVSFRVPKTSFRIDFVVEFQWSEIVIDDTAILLTTGRLRPEAAAMAHDVATYDVCTLADVNVDSCVDALMERFAQLIGAGFDVIELNGGVLSEGISLDKAVA